MCHLFCISCLSVAKGLETQKTLFLTLHIRRLLGALLCMQPSIRQPALFGWAFASTALMFVRIESTYLDTYLTLRRGGVKTAGSCTSPPLVSGGVHVPNPFPPNLSCRTLTRPLVCFALPCPNLCWSATRSAADYNHAKKLVGLWESSWPPPGACPWVPSPFSLFSLYVLRKSLSASLGLLSSCRTPLKNILIRHRQTSSSRRLIGL